MKLDPAQPGDRIETLPQCGVANGVLLEHVRIPEVGYRWKVRIEHPGPPFETLLRRSDFVVLRPAKEEDPAGARAQAKRKGASRG